MFVIGTASTEQGLQAARDHGADLVFNHKGEDYLNEIAVRIYNLTTKRIDLNSFEPYRMLLKIVMESI